MDLSHLTFVVLFYLCAGFFISMGFLKQNQVGRGFYVIHGLGATALALFIYFLVGRTVLAASATVWFVGFIVFGSLFSWSVGKNKRLVAVSFFLGLVCALGTIILDVVETVPAVIQTSVMVNSVLSALLLGFTMSAMLLGHWYLNQPKLSIDELKRLTLILLVLIGIRFLYGTVGIVLLLQPRTEADYRYLATNPGVFVLMRFFWGLLGPAFLAYFIWGTVKISSTQSATGILYVAVVVVLIGEILSQYLAFYHGIVF